MPRNSVTLDIPLVSGLSQSVDDKLGPDAFLAVADNVYFNKAGQLVKRWGYEDLGNTSLLLTIDGARKVTSFDRQRLVWDGKKLYSGSENQGWHPVGRLPSALVRKQEIGRDLRYDSSYPDVSVGGETILCAYVRNGQAVTPIYDKGTRSPLVSPNSSNAERGAATKIRCVPSDGRHHVIGYDAGTLRTSSCLNDGLSAGVSFTPWSSLATSVLTYWDACTFQSGFVVAYAQTNAINVDIYSDLGVLQSSTIVSMGAANATGITVCADDDGNGIFLFYSLNTGAGMRFRHITTGPIVVSAENIIGGSSGLSAGCTSFASGKAFVVWTSGAGGGAGRETWWAQVSTTATVLGPSSLDGFVARSRPFLHNDQIWCTFGESRKRGHILASWELNATGNVIDGVAPAAYFSPFSSWDDTSNEVAANVFPVDSDETEWITAVSEQTTLAVKRAESELGAPDQPDISARIGVALVSYFPEHEHCCQSVVFGDQLYLSGGLTTQFDGTAVFENGFLWSPYFRTIAETTGGSLSTTDTYIHVATWETYDHKANRHVSAPSEFRVTTLTGINDQIDLTVEPLTITMRQSDSDNPPMQCVVYRSQANGSPNQMNRILPLVSHPSTMYNNPEASSTNAPQTLTVSDTYADSTIDDQELLYTVGGVMENDLVPGGSCIVAHRDRLWVGGGYEPQRIYYSKPHEPGRPAEFNLAFYVDIPGTERVTALASMAGSLLVFTRSRIYLVTGEGPNNAGQGGQFRIEIANDNVGCDDPRTVVTTPRGVAFRGPRHIMLMTPALDLVAIGTAVDAETQEFDEVAEAVLLRDRNLVAFYVAKNDGAQTAILVWNYAQGELGEWTRWSILNTGQKTLAMGSISDRLLIGWDDGSTWLEDDTSYVDPDGAGFDFRMQVETNWINLGKLQDFGRCSYFYMLAEYVGEHDWDVSYALNYKPSFSTAVTIDDADLNNTPEQIRFKPRNQKCESIRFRLTERPPSPGTAGCKLNALSVEWMRKRRPMRLPPGRSK